MSPETKKKKKKKKEKKNLKKLYPWWMTDKLCFRPSLVWLQPNPRDNWDFFGSNLAFL
jgi:uncharacterized protein with von Willebrand factor type A (vWA) domain